MTRRTIVAGRRDRLFAFITVAGSLVLTFGALEIGLRLLGIDGRPLPPRQVEVSYDGQWQPIGEWGTSSLKRVSPYPEVMMGEYIPNITFRFVYTDRGGLFSRERWKKRAVMNRINSHGLRGREIAAAAPPGTVRLLMVGDSFTYGEGVEDDEAFSRKLEEILNGTLTKERGGLRYETINAGVSGYNTHDEYVYLKNRWIDFNPDMVVIVFYLNDAYDDSKFFSLITGAGAGASLEGAKASRSPSRAVEWVTNRLNRLKVAKQVKSIYQKQFSGTPTIEGYDWNDSRRALGEAKALTGRHGAGLALVIFPELYELTEKYPFKNIHDRVREAAEELGIPVLDLLDTFTGEAPETLWVHETDHHPNARAHEIAAGAIHRFLTDPRYSLLEKAQQ